MGTSKSTGGLGFLDFVTFNNAVLAKQLCRLLQHPDSLATHIIQAKIAPSHIHPRGNCGHTVFVCLGASKVPQN
jgi:hypothetical protein